LRPYYERLKDRGKHSRKAYIALGNKFIRIAFSINSVPVTTRIILFHKDVSQRLIFIPRNIVNSLYIFLRFI
jgi:hypothetical protein